MLHLAQVTKNPVSGQMELQLLACQNAEGIWAACQNNSLPMHPSNLNAEGVLLLVELDEQQKTIGMSNAKDWVLELIQKYLVFGAITPEFVQQEEERVEQWRQEITAQSLDLTRRHLELETRRDQLQELEASLQQEKEKREERWQELYKLQEELAKEREKP
jgi:small-conductance mechanosensitive channel